MNENNEMLLYIYENANMGVKSTTKLINILNNTDNKIKKIVEGELKGYENIEKKAKKLLKKYKVGPKDKGVIANIMSSIGMSFELMKDNSDSKVADMLIKGFTMGNIDITKKIDKYKGDCDKEILDIANELLNFGKENIKLLKDYL